MASYIHAVAADIARVAAVALAAEPSHTDPVQSSNNINNDNTNDDTKEKNDGHDHTLADTTTNMVISAAEDFASPLIVALVSGRPLLLVTTQDDRIPAVASQLASVLTAFSDADVHHVHCRPSLSADTLLAKALAVHPYTHAAGNTNVGSNNNVNATSPTSPTSPGSILYTSSRSLWAKSPETNAAVGGSTGVSNSGGRRSRGNDNDNDNEGDEEEGEGSHRHGGGHSHSHHHNHHSHHSRTHGIHNSGTNDNLGSSPTINNGVSSKKSLITNRSKTHHNHHTLNSRKNTIMETDDNDLENDDDENDVKPVPILLRHSKTYTQGTDPTTQQQPAAAIENTLTQQDSLELYDPKDDGPVHIIDDYNNNDSENQTNLGPNIEIDAAPTGSEPIQDSNERLGSEKNKLNASDMLHPDKSPKSSSFASNMKSTLVRALSKSSKKSAASAVSAKGYISSSDNGDSDSEDDDDFQTVEDRKGIKDDVSIQLRNFLKRGKSNNKLTNEQPTVVDDTKIISTSMGDDMTRDLLELDDDEIMRPALARPPLSSGRHSKYGSRKSRNSSGGIGEGPGDMTESLQSINPMLDTSYHTHQQSQSQSQSQPQQNQLKSQSLLSNQNSFVSFSNIDNRRAMTVSGGGHGGGAGGSMHYRGATGTNRMNSLDTGVTGPNGSRMRGGVSYGSSLLQVQSDQESMMLNGSGHVPNVLFVSDISNLNKGGMNLIMDIMQRKRIDFRGGSYVCPSTFMVVALVRESGLGHLPWPMLDDAVLNYNWFHKVDIGRPLLSVTLSSPLTTLGDIEALRGFLGQIFVHRDVSRYIRDIISFIRNHQFAFKGVSPKVSADIVLGCKILALVNGRDHVVIDDVKRIAVSAIAHRLQLNQWSVNAATRTRVTSDEVVRSVLLKVAIPK